jgi:hypothetical protein
MLHQINMDPGILSVILFSDEATFHQSGEVILHNVRIWGSENYHSFQELVCYSHKVNVWCGLMKNKVTGPFFFTEGYNNR